MVNVVGSSIARELLATSERSERQPLRTDAGMYLHAGPEIGVASTKAFTCQAAQTSKGGSFGRSLRSSL